MIATVQNTKRSLAYKGIPNVEVWEGRAQNGTRFHLFVVGAQPMDPNTLPQIKDRFTADLSEKKLPAEETAALSETIA